MKAVVAFLLSALLFVVLFALLNFVVEGSAVAARYWSDPKELSVTFLLSGMWVAMCMTPTAIVSAFARFNSALWYWLSVAAFASVLPLGAKLVARTSNAEKLLFGGLAWLAGVAAGAVFFWLKVLPPCRRRSRPINDT
jgi:hypothetical protein